MQSQRMPLVLMSVVLNFMIATFCIGGNYIWQMSPNYHLTAWLGGIAILILADFSISLCLLSA